MKKPPLGVTPGTVESTNHLLEDREEKKVEFFRYITTGLLYPPVKKSRGVPIIG
jgi:hypothetical protein